VSNASAVDLYSRGLLRPADVRAVSEQGEELPLALERYMRQPDGDEDGILDRAVGPVIDVGCGPGRHILALRRRGIHAVGVDIAPGVVQLARRRGAHVIEGSIFDRLPGAGSWGTALLLDGNIGIGGRPAGLLSRIRGLLHEDGAALVEVEPPGTSSETLRVRLQSISVCSDYFPWARVGADDLERLACISGYAVHDRWCVNGRWFAQLLRREAV